MTGKGWAYCLGCVALGAVGAVLFMKNREKLKPTAANLLAKGMRLKDKALDCAARTREHAEDIVAEAKHINETAADA
ncbi:MAG: hypothetical protein LBT97_05250 [Planctomycetota bacterium]|nr:hypothetical protein [Planctomycetota bacterium]